MTSSATLNDPMVKRLEAIQGLIEGGKLSEAAERLNEARKAAPTDARVFLLGMLLAETAGNPQGARQAGERVVKLAPDWPAGVTEVALLLARQNQFAEAIALARRAVKLAGNNAQVLGQVIDIAHRAQHFDLAIEWLKRAIPLAPENLHIKYLLARDYAQTGRHDEALVGFTALLKAKPGDAVLLTSRLKSRLALGQKELASEDGEALAALDPANADYAFWRDVAQGRTPERYPPSMVREMYDGFAEVFDQHLVSGLKYNLPAKVAAKIRKLYPMLKLNLLDLGCGTGLLGQQLGRIDGGLVGVELSPKMIERAGRHKVYDRFHNVDLHEALHETPDALWDVVTALDVFIHVGELGGVVADACRILKPGGHFIFSCESATQDEPPVVLRSTQRYAHRPGDVEALCRVAGFAEVSVESVTLRLEQNAPVAGFVVTATKAG